MKNKNIGIFDSGIGGLTIVKPLIDILPNENIIYFGDIARVPYGSRSNKTIYKYALQDINFLKSKNLKMVIAACGTVSSILFKNNINHSYFKDFYYTGIIEPTSFEAAKISQNKNIGIIGTRATINSKSYEICLKSLDSDIKTISVACPLFVSVVEEGLFKNKPKTAYDIIDMYLSDLKNSDIDTLILGCTHYPILSNLISEYFDNKIKLINPGVEVAKFVKKYLIKNNLLNTNGGEKNFFISDETNNFKDVANTFLDINIFENIDVIKLEDIDK